MLILSGFTSVAGFLLLIFIKVINTQNNRKCIGFYL